MKTLILFISLLSSSLYAHSTFTLSRYQLLNVDEKTMGSVAKLFEVERKIDRGFSVLVPTHQVKTLMALVPNATLITPDIATDLFADQKGFDLSDYRTFPQVEAQLKEWARKYPSLVSLIPYGKSAKGLTLWALKISDNVALNEAEPELMLTAATHGDELITVEVLLTMIEQLLQNYGKDKRLTDIVKGREIFFIPVVNPDGFSRRNRYDEMKDPNRSYPYPDDMKNTPTASIRPLMDFFDSHDFKGVIDFHAYGEMIMYPWSYTKKNIQVGHEDQMRDLTRRMAESNGYKHGQISEVIYIAKGSSADYYYMKKGTLALAIEMGTTKAPRADKIPAIVEEIAEPTWKFLEHFSTH